MLVIVCHTACSVSTTDPGFVWCTARGAGQPLTPSGLEVKAGANPIAINASNTQVQSPNQLTYSSAMTRAPDLAL